MLLRYVSSLEERRIQTDSEPWPLPDMDCQSDACVYPDGLTYGYCVDAANIGETCTKTMGDDDATPSERCSSGASCGEGSICGAKTGGFTFSSGDWAEVLKMMLNSPLHRRQSMHDRLGLRYRGHVRR